MFSGIGTACDWTSIHCCLQSDPSPCQLTGNTGLQEWYQSGISPSNLHCITVNFTVNFSANSCQRAMDWWSRVWITHSAERTSNNIPAFPAFPWQFLAQSSHCAGMDLWVHSTLSASLQRTQESTANAFPGTAPGWLWWEKCNAGSHYFKSKQTNQKAKRFLSKSVLGFLVPFGNHCFAQPAGAMRGISSTITPLIAVTGTRRLMRIICQPLTTEFLHYFIWLILIYLKWVTEKSEFSRLPFLIH